MYNRELSLFGLYEEKSLAAGVTVSAEGQLLVALQQGGVEVVQPCLGVASEVPVGFSVSTRLLIGQEVLALQVTIPSVGPFTVTLNNATNIVTGQVLVFSSTTTFTNVTPAGPATTQYSVDYVNGILTFAAADAGTAVTVFLKHNLTIAASRTLYREGFLFNARAFDVYGKIDCASGKGYIYTDQYDVSASYATGPLKTFAGGLVSTAGSGTTIPVTQARIISQPTVSNPFLGIEFNI